ncbi:MAG: hypothetical protein ACTHMC_29355 [Pseudobacter sp.]|uniref:hypothetical protein n=1 Tax=Pseudobacter sp. TaxID=2045420 RepID=UPI003F7D2311
MQDAKYIMVTNWDLHWDKLGPKWNNSTLFTLPIIKDGIEKSNFPEKAVTLFIKRSKSNELEKSWLGISKNFRQDPNKGNPAIRFEVSDLKEIDCPEEYKAYTNGWHLNKQCLPSPAIIDSIPEQHINTRPLFFTAMASCDWEQFEEYTFLLLRLLGIHELHRFPQTDNRGKADGFFKLGSLSVLYDATLEPNIESVKGVQLENFIHQLKSDNIKINEKLGYTIKDNDRQVWIITRGHIVRSLRIHDQIEVKEIPYAKLIEIYDKRLQEEWTILQLSRQLKDL